MTDASGALNPSSSLMNTALRMVIPLKREFDRSLDVQHFLDNPAYAREVIEQALNSQNPRLRQYAVYMSDHLLGRRNGPDRMLARTDATPTAAAPTPAATTSPAVTSAEAAARQQVLDKYRTGLR